MAAAYQRAISYSDAGEVRFKFLDNGRPFDANYDWSVTFERPNKLRLHVYSANAVCDGKYFWATLAEVPGQVLKLPAPATLTPDNICANEVLFDQMANRVAGPAVALSLLLSDNPLAVILHDADEPKLLEPKTIDDARCRGVSIRRKDGELVFWIDEVGYELRRIEFPIAELDKYLQSQAGKISDLSLVADLTGAKFDPKIHAVAFRFEAPKDARIVTNFNSQPQPLPPTRWLGKRIDDFRFTKLDGTPVTRETLRGKVAVLDFWATWCGPCFQTLPELQKVYERYKDNDRVVIVAVSIDRSDATTASAATTDGRMDIPAVGDSQVREAFERAKLSIPIVRDPTQQANTVFGVEQIPNIFVLGPDGTVEDHEIGIDPELAKELPGRIEKLLAGGSVHAETLRRYAQRVREYEAQLQASSAPNAGSGGNTTEQFQRGTIAPRSEPKHLKLAHRWSTKEVKQPGNIVVVPGEQPRIVVVAGLTAVAELDLDGKLVATHTLDLPKEPEEGIVAFVRTAVDRSGARWYVGAAGDRQQLHLFDDGWKRRLSYPEAASAGGIADVQLADLDGDGDPEMNVGYYNVVGVQNVAPDGHRRWANRSLSNVMSLAVTGPDADGHRALWCAHEQGTIVPIDFQGHEKPPITVGQRFVRLLKSADLDGDGKNEYLALATTGTGQDTAVGLDVAGREQWSLTLPRGLQPVPSVEPVTSGALAHKSADQWIIVGSDGSIYVVAADGAVVDHWQHGAAISGLAVAEGRRLLIATTEGVELWQVSE
jgi:thiol-disulfide isomerase/thioredoxin